MNYFLESIFVVLLCMTGTNIFLDVWKAALGEFYQWLRYSDLEHFVQQLKVHLNIISEGLGDVQLIQTLAV